MSKLGKETGFIPLPYANTEVVRVDLNLPRYISAEGIGLHIKNTERMCRIGGIKHLSIVGDSQETTSTEVNIVGFNNQGEAYAGKGKTSSVPTATSQSQAEDYRFFLTPFEDQINITTKINVDEIAFRINQNNSCKEGVRSTQAWAGCLNNDIKEAIRKEGTYHLLYGLTKLQWVFLFWMSLPTNQAIHPAIQIAAGNIAANIACRIYTRFSGQKSRFSLFYGPEFDRATILNVMSKTNTLVKACDSTL